MILKRAALAKINLGLHVLRRRPDGYHDLETVFLRIGWADALTAEAGDTLSLSCSDPTLTTREDNLVMKAARLLAQEADIAAGARLHLDKHLPMGAGLGGGSSDAAAALRLLDRLWQLGLPDERLRALAAQLGSDVPFFLGPSAAYATGRGEQLAPLLDPETDDVYQLPFALVVVVPPVHVATAEAYRLVTPDAEDRPDLRTLVLSNDLDRWQVELTNDFEAPLFRAHPSIAAVKQLLLDAGAGYAAMSGSGSAVYGVFEDAGTAEAAAEAARLAGHRVWHGVTG